MIVTTYSHGDHKNITPLLFRRVKALKIVSRKHDQNGELDQEDLACLSELQLEYLDVSHTNMSSLPKQLYLEKIKKLNVSGTSISHLPTTLFSLEHVEGIRGRNKTNGDPTKDIITYVPASFHRIPNPPVCSLRLELQEVEYDYSKKKEPVSIVPSRRSKRIQEQALTSAPTDPSKPSDAARRRIGKAMRENIQCIGIQTSDKLLSILIQGTNPRATPYQVIIGSTPTCTCPDFLTTSRDQGGKKRCKHIFFSMIYVLGYNENDPMIWKESFTSEEVDHVMKRDRVCKGLRQQQSSHFRLSDVSASASASSSGSSSTSSRQPPNGTSIRQPLQPPHPPPIPSAPSFSIQRQHFSSAAMAISAHSAHSAHASHSTHPSDSHFSDSHRSSSHSVHASHPAHSFSSIPSHSDPHAHPSIRSACPSHDPLPPEHDSSIEWEKRDSFRCELTNPIGDVIDVLGHIKSFSPPFSDDPCTISTTVIDLVDTRRTVRNGIAPLGLLVKDTCEHIYPLISLFLPEWSSDCNFRVKERLPEWMSKALVRKKIRTVDDRRIQKLIEDMKREMESNQMHIAIRHVLDPYKPTVDESWNRNQVPLSWFWEHLIHLQKAKRVEEKLDPLYELTRVLSWNTDLYFFIHLLLRKHHFTKHLLYPWHFVLASFAHWEENRDGTYMFTPLVSESDAREIWRNCMNIFVLGSFIKHVRSTFLQPLTGTIYEKKTKLHHFLSGYINVGMPLYSISPMLCSPYQPKPARMCASPMLLLPSKKKFLIQPKYDGERILLIIPQNKNNPIRFMSRHGCNQSKRMFDVEKHERFWHSFQDAFRLDDEHLLEIQNKVTSDADIDPWNDVFAIQQDSQKRNVYGVFDGELIAVKYLQQADTRRRIILPFGSHTSFARSGDNEEPTVYHASDVDGNPELTVDSHIAIALFDCPYAVQDGIVICTKESTCMERITALETLVRENDFLFCAPLLGPLTDDPSTVYQCFLRALQDEYEGIVLKHHLSTYRYEARTQDWIKLKPQHIKEEWMNPFTCKKLVVIGYKLVGNRVQHILLGFPLDATETENKKFRVIANVERSYFTGGRDSWYHLEYLLKIEEDKLYVPYNEQRWLDAVVNTSFCLTAVNRPTYVINVNQGKSDFYVAEMNCSPPHKTLYDMATDLYYSIHRFYYVHRFTRESNQESKWDVKEWKHSANQFQEALQAKLLSLTS